MADIQKSSLDKKDPTRSHAKSKAQISVRNLGVVVLAVLGVSAIFWASAHIIGLDENGILNQTFRSFSDSPWAPLIVATAYMLASLIGAPQFLLIAVTVAVFGSLNGFFLSLFATLCSATFNFLLARFVGAEWLRNRGWGGVDDMMETVGRNGFLTSLIVRVVPSAPFIVVNMGLGLTNTTFLAFLTGTAIGILPKTALIALLGKVVERAQSGDIVAIGYLAAALTCWLLIAFVGKYVLERRGRSSKP